MTISASAAGCFFSQQQQHQQQHHGDGGAAWDIVLWACGIVTGDFSDKSQDLMKEPPMGVAQLKETVLPGCVDGLETVFLPVLRGW